ncbi:hypothetical protein [Streptomyces sp. NPDC004285]
MASSVPVDEAVVTRTPEERQVCAELAVRSGLRQTADGVARVIRRAQVTPWIEHYGLRAPE